MRTIFFSSLWILLISTDSTYVALSILLFSLSLSLFFLISLRRATTTIYVFLTLIGLGHALVLGNGSLLPILYVQSLTIDATYHLSPSLLKVLLAVNGSLSILTAFITGERIIESILIVSLFMIVLVTYHQIVFERNERKMMYEDLLEEYRKAKRLNVTANNNARIEERAKIARDIHDSVGHQLTALIMKLEVLSIQNPHINYNELKKMAKNSLEETRTAVTALQTEEHEGISSVVQLIRKLEAESHLHVQFTIKQGALSFPLTNQKSVVLYRIIQEALTNAMRHSQAREAKVTLATSATSDLSFEIRNAVFQPVSFSYGFGLTNMKKRIEEVEGTLTIQQTNESFIVFGTIP